MTIKWGWNFTRLFKGEIDPPLFFTGDDGWSTDSRSEFMGGENFRGTGNWELEWTNIDAMMIGVYFVKETR